MGGVAYSASSERVKILNVNVENARISANGRVGGIIGWVIDSTKGVEISGCSVTGDISAVYNKTADDDGDKAGGILGQASSDCIISDCSYSDGTVSAYREAAGILGTAASGSAEVTGSSVSDAFIVQDKTNGASDDPKCGQIIGRVGDNNSIAVGGNDFSDHVELISDNSSENGIGSDGAGLEMMSVKIENEYFAGLEEALEAAEDMSGSVKIELIGDLDISGANINFDLSDSEIERLTICSDGGENRKIMSGVDGNDIDGPVYCPSINIKLPENAELIIRDLTFPDDLSFDSRDGSVLIKNCVFNGSISDYPAADRIEFRDNTFDFDGTAGNFYTNNAFPIWYKVQNDMEFVFENNTVKGLRGVHIETSSGKVDMTVDYNRFELKDSSYTNKAIAFQLVGMINGDVSFSSNYVDAYMGVCLFKNIKWIDGSSLTIDNNYIKDGCKLYGSSEWNADGVTDSEKEKNADKSAEEFLKNKGVDVDREHTHEYEDGICIICGHKKQDSGDKESKPSSSISLPEIIRDDKTDKTDKTDKVTNPDGSVTTKTENPDGSTVETTNYADGSTRTVTTSSDGTVTTVLTDGYGNYTDTVEDTYGNKSIMISNVDGSWSETIVNSDGWMKSDVKVPDDKIIKEIREQGYVSLPIPIVSNTKDRNKAAVISVDLTGMDALVEIPVINGGAGTVIIKMQNDGTEEIIKDTVFTGKGVAAEISDGDTIMILDNSKEFTDVKADFWGKDAVDFVTGREIFSGISDGLFDPDGTMTRAMIWTVLARLDGQDVDGGLGLWYEKGQKWAVDNGISDGTDPDKAVTREQLVSMLYRYASLKGDVSNKTDDLSSFADAGNIRGYAVDGLKWAVSEGIISGNGDGYIDPQGKASRAQTAVMIMKLCQE